MKYIIFVAILLSMLIGGIYGLVIKEEPRNQAENPEEIQNEKTEKFIYRLLKNDNGTIATYIKNNDAVDEDLVKGRESLAETLGLLMYYALGKDDQTLFNRFYKQLTDYFLENDGFINWKLNEDGASDVTANAFVDDIRILYALAMADEKWHVDQYMTTAVSISGYLNEHNSVDDIYTNFYDQEYDYASSNISLSYIDIQGMEYLVDRGLLDSDIVSKTSEILMKAPLKNGFYPLSYNIEENEYTFSENINIVDQIILAYHYAQVGNKSKEFLKFIKNEIDNRGIIHGMYDRNTQEPTVDYESPAIYGFLILYTLEVGEEELAHTIYTRLKEFQVVDTDSEYYGGYSITEGDTHVFDNLVPLLAEQEINNLE